MDHFEAKNVWTTRKWRPNQPKNQQIVVEFNIEMTVFTVFKKFRPSQQNGHIIFVDLNSTTTISINFCWFFWNFLKSFGKAWI